MNNIESAISAFKKNQMSILTLEKIIEGNKSYLQVLSDENIEFLEEILDNENVANERKIRERWHPKKNSKMTGFNQFLNEIKEGKRVMICGRNVDECPCENSLKCENCRAKCKEIELI